MRIRSGILFLAVLVCAAGLGLLGLYYLFTTDLPNISSLKEYRPPIVTSVLAEENETVGEFFLERRIVVPTERIPRTLIHAVISAEDSKFYSHVGLDFWGILRAMLKNIAAGEVVQGGSTITQQVVKSMLLTPERSFKRKFREAILAYRLEKSLSKDDILYLYLNQIYFGNGAYGVQAAAQNYFGCNVEDLNLAQCALLAALPRAPNRYSPIKNPAHAKERQRYVLHRMVEDGFITKQEAEEAARRPVEVKEREDLNLKLAPYYVEYVREYLAQRYGTDLLYKGGLKVYTAMSVSDQKAAQEAIDYGLRAFERRHGFRGPVRHLSEEEIRALESRGLERWSERLRKGEIYPGLVQGPPQADRGIPVRVGDTVGWVPAKEAAWALRGGGGVPPLTRGDVVDVRLEGIEPDGTGIFSLQQEPQVEGALLSIEIPNGYVRAMVGGHDYRKSAFNRAVQALRQPGSAFKPVIYAAAIDRGYTPATIVVDAPLVIEDPATGQQWQPQNYSGDFAGPITVRDALAHSRNVVTVKILKDIGIPYAIDYARRLGITSPLSPYLSLALGSSSVTLMELTQAYAVFANQGSRPSPIFVKTVLDRDGNVLEVNLPTAEQVISPQAAYIVTNLLESVVEEGTGKSVSALSVPCAGKTGTTNDYVDAWFLGYTPHKVAGVWVGYDKPRSLGERETGAKAAAPIWLYYMRKVVGKGAPADEFPIPEGIVFANIDTATGLLATPNSYRTRLECFKAGTEPMVSAEEYGRQEEEEESEFLLRELEVNPRELREQQE